MERMKSVKGNNGGAERADDQPKVVAQLPEDSELKEPREAAKEDGFPGSCQI